MGKFQIPENPDFSVDLEEIGVERAYPIVFNNPLKRLLTNTAHLKVKTDITDTHIANANAHVSVEQKDAWTAKADDVLATQEKKGQMSPADKSKLDTIAANAEVNQNAINNIRVGNTNVYSNAREGQIILVPGSNVTISADNATKVITIGATVPPSLPANGGHASTCDKAYNANNADRLNGVTWNYAGQGGTPAWVWGSTSGNLTDQYVFSPSNFSVNYANSANTCNRATNANWADGATNATNAGYANNSGAVRGFPFTVAIQAGAPNDGNALWVQ